MKWKWNLPIYYFCFLIVFDLLSSNYIRELDSYTLMYNTYSYIRTFYHLMPLILIIVITIIELLKKKRSFKNLINLVFYNLVALYAVSTFFGFFIPNLGNVNT